VLDLMERMSQELGKTIVMVTHDQRAAERAHRVRHLDKGTLNDSEGVDI
jgi:putative ABC transport system ATP-binding protein